MISSSFPRLVLPEWVTDELDLLHMQDRGLLSGTSVLLEDGSRYAISFYVPMAVYSDVHLSALAGAPCWLEMTPAVVVPDVALETLSTCVRHLHRVGYFQHLRPVGDAPVPTHLAHDDSTGAPRLVMPDDLSDRDAFELPINGCLRGASALFRDGSSFPVSFYHPIVLKQRCDAALATGKPCFAEPGMIPVPELQLSRFCIWPRDEREHSLEQVVEFVAVYGFFRYLQPSSG